MKKLLLVILLTITFISNGYAVIPPENKNEFRHLWSGETEYAFKYKTCQRGLGSGYTQSNFFEISDFDLPDRNSLLVMFINGKWGYVNSGGKIVIQPQYDDANPFYRGLAAVCNKDKWGYINEQNELVIPYMYDAVSKFWEGYIQGKKYKVAFVKKGRNHYLINEKNQRISSETYEGCDDFEDDGFTPGYAPAEKNGKWGFVNLKGEWVIQPQYDYAYPFASGTAAVEVAGKWGYITYDWKTESVSWLFEPQFEDGGFFRNGMLTIKMGDGWGFMNRNGDIIGPFEEFREHSGYFYTFVPVRTEFVACVKKNGKWGCINREGKVLLEFAFDEIGRPSYLTPTRKVQKWIYYDFDGNVIPKLFDYAGEICNTTKISRVHYNGSDMYLYFNPNSKTITKEGKRMDSYEFYSYKEAWEAMKIDFDEYEEEELVE